MEFKSHNPADTYHFIEHNGLKIYLHKDDLTVETINAIKQHCDSKNLTPSLHAQIYYLRGHRKKVAFDQVLIGALEAGKTLPKELWEVIHCTAFWNQEGAECHRMNGVMGESYRDFILKCMACDCRVFVDASSEQFITGTGGNHIWIADKRTGERILIFYFIDDKSSDHEKGR